MTEEKANLFMLGVKEYLPNESLSMVRGRLDKVDDSKANIMSVMNFKSPTIAIILSVLIGTLGIDRFYAGDIGLGILKLLTAGGCGIWWFIDLFLIMKRVKEKNLNDLMNALQ